MSKTSRLNSYPPDVFGQQTKPTPPKKPQKTFSLRGVPAPLVPMTSSPTSVYSSEVINIIRLRQMSDLGSTNAFHTLLEWLTPSWNRPKASFSEYMKNKKNVSMKELKNVLKPGQKNIIKKDPTGRTWDISLLYVLILYGNEFLADRNDPVWNKYVASSTRLESLITSVKNTRNDIVHCYDPIDNNLFVQRTEELRKLLNEMITHAGRICTHISNMEVNKTVAELNITINRCRDDPLEPKDVNEYRKQRLFQQQRSRVEDEGRKELCKRHSKYKTLSPTSHLVNVKVPVEDVYTQMVLEGDDMKKVVTMENILAGDNQLITDAIILVEGEAGVGKTTLTKKIMHDWISGKKDIEGLDQFPIIFHAECRDYINSFKGLIANSMPEITKSFREEDLLLIIGDLRTLVILDGLDELNPDSAKLFKELLMFKNSHDKITILVATRPEAVRTYFQNVDSNQNETKHIHLLGIPAEKRDEFIRKYYESIEKFGLREQSIGSLIKYLLKTDYSLGSIWKLPFNLTLLVILWTMKPFIINSITTAPELHWEMLLFYIEKLEERLRNNHLTRHIPQSLLKRKLELFLYSLCEEALKALADNSITLDQEACRRLEEKCHNLEIPVEEMLGMFLKQTSSVSGIRYSFPHKSIIDFLAAKYIFMQLTDIFISLDIHKIKVGLENLLSQNAVPSKLSYNIMTAVESTLTETLSEGRSVACTTAGSAVEESTVITNILKKIENSQTFNITKYQNILIFLIGMFYLEKNIIEESTKREALQLLQKTGIRNRRQWLEVLNGVKCDQYVASFIVTQSGILDGDIKIDDSSVFAYISLLRALDVTLNMKSSNASCLGGIIWKVLGYLETVNVSNVNISIDVKEGMEEINVLLHEIDTKKLNVKELSFQHDFRHPNSPKMHSDITANILKNCDVTNYRGAITLDTPLPKTLKFLYVSMGSTESIQVLNTFLPTLQLTVLHICLPPLNDSQLAKALLSDCLMDTNIRCYITDITASNISDASSIVKKVQPEKKCFSRVAFPRATLTAVDITDLIEAFHSKDVKVEESLLFPNFTISQEEKSQIEAHAKEKLGCKDGVFWGRVGLIESIDDW